MIWIDDAGADLPHWLMTIGYGQHVIRAPIAWCDESLATLESLEDVAGFHLGAGTPSGPRDLR